MKPGFLVLLLSAVSLAAGASAKEPAAYPAIYAGGTLPLNQHKVKAALDNDAVVLIQGAQRIAIPTRYITAISCGSTVRRRLGAPVLAAVPLMHLDKSETYYIGLAWSAGGDHAPPAQLLLRLNRSDYAELLAALEQLTGIKAVDTNRVPTVVRYEI